MADFFNDICAHRTAGADIKRPSQSGLLLIVNSDEQAVEVCDRSRKVAGR